MGCSSTPAARENFMGTFGRDCERRGARVRGDRGRRAEPAERLVQGRSRIAVGTANSRKNPKFASDSYGEFYVNDYGISVIGCAGPACDLSLTTEAEDRFVGTVSPPELGAKNFPPAQLAQNRSASLHSLLRNLRTVASPRFPFLTRVVFAQRRSIGRPDHFAFRRTSP